MSQYKQVAIRFFSVFLAGGLASAAILFTTGVQLTSSDDLKKFGTSLLVAFVGGGIAAFEKSLVPTPTTTQTVIQPLAQSSQNAPGVTVITSTSNLPDNTSVTTIPSITPPQE